MSKQFTEFSNLRNDDFPRKFDNFSVDELSDLIRNKKISVNQSNDYDKSTLLMRAAMNNNYEICELLINNEAKPDYQNYQGQTALHFAVENKNHKIINLLLENNADPNIQDQVIFFNKFFEGRIYSYAYFL
jgi:ankyrin repeat protein